MAEGGGWLFSISGYRNPGLCRYQRVRQGAATADKQKGRPLAVKSIRRVALGALLGVALVAASALPAFAASKPVALSANALRSAGAKVVITVDGQVVKPGQVVKGREVEARITLPNKVKLAKPTAVSLVDYQTNSFDLKSSDQRFLQATSTRLLSGRTTVLKLGLRCQMKVGRWCGGKLYKHQLDVVIGKTIIGADRPFEWLGTYPKYNGKQLLGAAFVKAKCRPVHGTPKPCKSGCERKHWR